MIDLVPQMWTFPLFVLRTLDICFWLRLLVFLRANGCTTHWEDEFTCLLDCGQQFFVKV